MRIGTMRIGTTRIRTVRTWVVATGEFKSAFAGMDAFIGATTVSSQHTRG